MNRFYILTGSPGSGKSSILTALSKKSFSVIEEPARKILAQQRLIDGEGVYDRNPFLFKELMLSCMLMDYENASKYDIVFFDRGIPDIIAYSKNFGLNSGAELQASQIYRYNTTVFFLPAWHDIYVNDAERKLSFEEAQLFEDDLRQIYTKLEYKLVDVPFGSIKDRVNFILNLIRGSKE
ncbi:TPA: AAA family ATPase [Legionella pneumophila subsp. pneumophila]|uniref:AAA family ATPase n=1 Tax=Legionella taurinensis TaxID=70611 RepID=UPI000E71CFAD|nr:AAA family ATPase [Legionella taurinensis]RJT65499.1 ATPase [Legionella taurinensis]HAT8890284.1 AAA family ATPase [Legionella pneumophila subsp. pneumophila]